MFSLQDKWIDYYLTGLAPSRPTTTAYTEVCPQRRTSAGPYTAANWASARPGCEITVEEAADQTIEPDGGSADVANAYGSSPTMPAPARAAPGNPATANYESGPGTGRWFHSCSARADRDRRLRRGGRESEIAARLVDVAPDNTWGSLWPASSTGPTRAGYRCSSPSRAWTKLRVISPGWSCCRRDAEHAAFVTQPVRITGDLLTCRRRSRSMTRPPAAGDREPGGLGGLVKGPGSEDPAG